MAAILDLQIFAVFVGYNPVNMVKTAISEIVKDIDRKFSILAKAGEFIYKYLTICATMVHYLHRVMDLVLLCFHSEIKS